MRIFKRNQRQGSSSGGNGAIYLSSDPVPMPGNPFGPLQFAGRRPLPGSTEEALESARGSVKDLAESSRAEIADLVAEDRAQVAALVAEAVKKSEDRIREVAARSGGSAEGADLANAREMEERLRKEISDTVKAEVAKTIGELRAKAAKAKGAQKDGDGAAKNGNGSSRNGSARHRNTSRSKNGRAKTAA